MSLYQITTPLISLIAILYVWSLLGRKKKTIWEASLWSLFWGSIAVIALFPDSIDILKTITGINERENAVVITAIGILFFIVFYLISKVEDLERKQVEFVRKIALMEFEEVQKSKTKPKKKQ